MIARFLAAIGAWLRHSIQDLGFAVRSFFIIIAASGGLFRRHCSSFHRRPEWRPVEREPMGVTEEPRYRGSLPLGGSCDGLGTRSAAQDPA